MLRNARSAWSGMPVRLGPEWVFGLGRNGCSAWAGMGVRLGPEWVFALGRCTHLVTGSYLYIRPDFRRGTSRFSANLSRTLATVV